MFTATIHFTVCLILLVISGADYTSAASGAFALQSKPSFDFSCPKDVIARLTTLPKHHSASLEIKFPSTRPLVTKGLTASTCQAHVSISKPKEKALVMKRISIAGISGQDHIQGKFAPTVKLGGRRILAPEIPLFTSLKGVQGKKFTRNVEIASEERVGCGKESVAIEVTSILRAGNSNSKSKEEYEKYEFEIADCTN
jgi:hypothetical protein